MTKYLLSAVLLNSVICFAQINYKPIPENNATWIQADFLYSAYNGHEHATVTSVVYTQNDTLINGLTYRKFRSHAIADWIDNFGSQQNQTSGTDYIAYSEGYFRQDTLLKKVYLWNNFTQEDELLYDFQNLTIGQPYPETVTNIIYPNLLVMATDSVELMDGNYYKRWVLGTNSSDSAYVSVIEGVGGTNGFNSMIYPVFEQSSALLCHKVNTQQIYENWVTPFLPPRYSEDCSNTLSTKEQVETSLTLYPNPTNANATIVTNKAIKSIQVCQISGQLLFKQENDILGKTATIDLSKLESGTYLLKIVLSNDSVTVQQIQLLK